MCGAGPQCYVGVQIGKGIAPDTLESCCAPTHQCIHDPTNDHDYCCALPHLTVAIQPGALRPLQLHAMVTFSAVQSMCQHDVTAPHGTHRRPRLFCHSVTAMLCSSRVAMLAASCLYPAAGMTVDPAVTQAARGSSTVHLRHQTILCAVTTA